MTIDIHRQEAGQLQKAGIHISSHPCIAIRNGADAMAPKPFAAALLGQKINLGWATPGIDRTAHQRH